MIHSSESVYPKQSSLSYVALESMINSSESVDADSFKWTKMIHQFESLYVLCFGLIYLNYGIFCILYKLTCSSLIVILTEIQMNQQEWSQWSSCDLSPVKYFSRDYNEINVTVSDFTFEIVSVSTHKQ